MNWKHGLFAARSPRQFHKLSKALLWGITLWVEKNNAIFRREGCQIEKVQTCIWNGLLDNCRASWYNCLGTIKRRPIVKQALLESFDKIWGPNNVICSRIGRFVRCYYDGPCRGLIG
jgi:hypothetical protein